MDYKNKLQYYKEISKIFEENRRIGTTTLLTSISKTNNCLILFSNDNLRRLFGNSGFNINSLKNHDHRGKQYEAILVDNGAMIEILYKAQEDITSLSKELISKEREIEDLRAELLTLRNKIHHYKGNRESIE